MAYGWDFSSKNTIFGIADYSTSSGEIVPATIATTSHHLWYMPLCVAYMRVCNTPLTKFHLYCSIAWICLVSAGTALIVPLECVNFTLKSGVEICMR